MADDNETRDEVARLRSQAAALAEFGRHSLRTHDLDALLHEACQQVSRATGIELVKVLQLLPGGETMLMRAGVNWKAGVVGRATFGAHRDSPSGYALQEDRPIVSRDTAAEDRFKIPQLMIDHNVRSMVNVVIRGERAAWGVLEIDSRQPRDFDADDVSFLENYANLLAAAIERLHFESELREASEHGNILLGELQNRVRNLLTNVHALARRTARASSTLAEFLQAFELRLLALGRAQDLLSRGVSVSVSLKEALRQELTAHGVEDDSRRVRLSGPDVVLPPKEVQALAMAFHELATNASKYGALAHADASLEVSWQVLTGADVEELSIRWSETGVSITKVPERRGFGSETIEQSLPYMIGGEARMIFRPEGLECTIRFPFAGRPAGTPWPER